MDALSPKDRFVTVFGRKPVLEALADRDLRVDKIVLADNARGLNRDGKKRTPMMQVTGGRDPG